jgi:hypothetical protein
MDKPPLIVRSRSDGHTEIVVLEPSCPPMILVCKPGCPRRPFALPLDPAIRMAVATVLRQCGWQVVETWVEMDAGAAYASKEG